MLTSLKMSPAELIKQRHHRRVAPSSEIASIIDALIYQLGIRSAAEAPPPPAPENEEPEAAPEPEKPDDDPKEPTGAERAAQCRSKVNSLFSRMTTQLEAAEGVGAQRHGRHRPARRGPRHRQVPAPGHRGLATEE